MTSFPYPKLNREEKMSIVIQIKAIIISNLNAPKELKEGVLKFLNELDTDLDTGGYEPSSLMEAVSNDLDKILIDLDSPSLNDDVEETEDEEDNSALQGREIPTEDDEE